MIARILSISMPPGLPITSQRRAFMELYILQREENGVTHFHLLTFWDSIESIQAFAGTDIDKARYYPEDADYLLELEPTVIHYT